MFLGITTRHEQEMTTRRIPFCNSSEIAWAAGKGCEAIEGIGPICIVSIEASPASNGECVGTESSGFGLEEVFFDHRPPEVIRTIGAELIGQWWYGGISRQDPFAR